MMATNSPSAIVSDAPSSARTSTRPRRYVFETRSTTTADVAVVSTPDGGAATFEDIVATIVAS
jgi:hypothetical protein